MQTCYVSLKKQQCAIDTEVVIGKGVDALSQAHEPPALGIVGSKFGRHTEFSQGGEVKRCAARKVGLHPFD
jgi:hypothetical protein